MKRPDIEDIKRDVERYSEFQWGRDIKELIAYVEWLEGNVQKLEKFIFNELGEEMYSDDH